MNTVVWRAWEFLSGLATPKFVTRETAVLLILAASLLVFRTLRERCLMVWIVGWLAYLKDTEGNILGIMHRDPAAK